MAESESPSRTHRSGSDPHECYRVAVLASGRGSNLQALLDRQLTDNYKVVAVLSDKPQARALALAREASIEPIALNWATRAEGEFQLRDHLQRLQPDLIVLAGFMRILSPASVTPWLGKMINIHPSLLPLYPGLHTHRRVLEDGRKVHGASVHFVTEELDGGPVISQTRLPVLPEDTPESLALRLLPGEHRLLTQTVSWLRHGVIQLADRQVMYNGTPLKEPLIVP